MAVTQVKIPHFKNAGTSTAGFKMPRSILVIGMQAAMPQRARLNYGLLLLIVSRIAILAASCLIPAPIRCAWRRQWISQLQHYATLLWKRGMQGRYVRARILHHLIGAMRDAWRLFSDRPAMRNFRLIVSTPGFSLGLIILAVAAIATASHGLSVTRAMLAPPYRDAHSLVLISEGGALPNGRQAVALPLLDYWKAHNTSFSGLAGYRWDSHGTAWVTPEFFQVVGGQPHLFLLHRIREWKPALPGQDLAVVGRLKPGVTVAAAQAELRNMEAQFGNNEHLPVANQAQAMGLVARTRKPFWAYAVVCSVTSLLLLAAAGIGMRTDRRRIGRVRGWYWAYFCAKAVSLPLLLALVIWEFSRATSFTMTGGARFVAEPFFVWLVILACGAIVWWCLVDQWARCRACLNILQYPVRIGSLGAVLFDHAGTELMCREGHGSLYLPAVSSDYVQRAGWTALDLEGLGEDPRPEDVHTGSHFK